MCCLGVDEGPHHSGQLVPTYQGSLGHPYRTCHLPVGDSFLLGHRQCSSLRNLMTWHHCGPSQLFKESHKSGPVSRLQK